MAAKVWGQDRGAERQAEAYREQRDVAGGRRAARRRHAVQSDAAARRRSQAGHKSPGAEVACSMVEERAGKGVALRKLLRGRCLSASRDHPREERFYARLLQAISLLHATPAAPSDLLDPPCKLLAPSLIDFRNPSSPPLSLAPIAEFLAGVSLAVKGRDLGESRREEERDL